MTDLLAPIPLGDGPKRSHIHLRNALSNIARRVAMKALAEGRRDVLLEVYAAGLAHAAELSPRLDEDSGRRCFTYCGDDRCTCGAGPMPGEGTP